MNKNRHSKKIPDIQGSLPFGSRNQGGIFAYAHPLERRAVVLVGVGFVLLAILYVYFLFSSVVHVAAHRELVRSASRASAEVANLETAYLAKTQTFTEPYARSLGYVAVKNPTFVSKSSVVSFNNGR
ncbi:MAG: hypothetical protein V4449_03395 [Patescibacteria group bacterium]